MAAAEAAKAVAMEQEGRAHLAEGDLAAEEAAVVEKGPG